MSCSFNSFKCIIGDFLRAGDVIGLVGNSGNTMGPHIHYQVQAGYDFSTASGLPIKFKNYKITNKKIQRKYLSCGMYVKTC